MKKTKILSLLGAVLVLSLSSCNIGAVNIVVGNSSSDSSSIEETTSEQTTEDGTTSSDASSENNNNDNTESLDNSEDSKTNESSTVVETTELVEETTSSSSSDSNPEIWENDDEYFTEEYSFNHTWVAADFGSSVSSQKLTAGSLTLDGLTWSYTAVSTYFADDTNNNKGLQIGSSNNPQTEGWTLSCDFGETVQITYFSVVLSCGSQGSFSYDVSIDNNSVFSNTSSSTSPSTYSTNLSSIGSSLSLTLTASSKAMYIDTMYFILLVNKDSNLIGGSGAPDYSGDGSDSPSTGGSSSGEYEIDPTIESRDPITPGTGSIPSTKYTVSSSTVTNYYKDIDMTETGTKLEKDLHDLISSMTMYSYGDARYILCYADESVYYPGYVYGFYDGDLLNAEWDQGATWNREHTWPCVRMYASNSTGGRPDNYTKNRTSDLHNLRACCSTGNTARGAGYFDTYSSSNTFYPNYTKGALSGSTHRYEGDFRGDAARICFYMYVRYGRYDDEITLNLSSNISDLDYYTMGNLSTLLTWNQEDPVDEFETQRNNRIYEYQGNRNPFIDYPDLANNLFA